MKIQINIFEWMNEQNELYCSCTVWNVTSKVSFHEYFGLIGQPENKEAHKINDYKRIAMKQTNGTQMGRVTNGLAVLSKVLDRLPREASVIRWCLHWNH